MADPLEGVAPDGTIRTGAGRERVCATFEPVLRDAIQWLSSSGSSIYVYGSVANGTARTPTSDVDLLSIDLPDAPSLGDALTHRYADICRSVDVAAATSADLAGDSDAAYGIRVFLRHYCVHLAGPDPTGGLPAFPADARAARGFNGDLAQHLVRWRASREGHTNSAKGLGLRIARKTLLAVAGLVSVHDHTWTTDRDHAASRWGEVEPRLAADLERLHAWVTGEREPSPDSVRTLLAEDGAIDLIVGRFHDVVGLWPDQPWQP
jgi:hypothetical protein